jgi:hypothetical protein
VRHRRADRRQLVGLFLDRGDDLRVLVADRDVDELRREVEVPVALVVPEVASLAARDRERLDLVLHRPRVQDVLLVELLDPLGVQPCFDGHAGSLPRRSLRLPASERTI